MIKFPSVDELLEGPLGQWLDKEAGIRVAARKKSITRLIIVVVVGAPLLYLLFTRTSMDTGLKAFIAFVVLFIAVVWVSYPVTKVVGEVKTRINQTLAEALGLEYHKDCDATPAFRSARSYELVPDYDRAGFEDLWIGEVNGCEFTVQEAHLEEEHDTGDDDITWVSVFRGPIMSVGFDDEFSGVTLVARKGSHRSFFGSTKDSIKLNGQQLDIADMVNPEFTDSFDVYTTDQTEARWLVHPEYVERLIAVERSFKGDDLAALFVSGKLIVTLDSGNLFESGSINPSKDRERVQRTISQLKGLSDLAFTLNHVDPDD